MTKLRNTKQRLGSFSLVEVVLALGVVGFAIVAILGVVPVGLSSGRGAQDESRAAEIGQSVFAAFSSQKFDAIAIASFDATGAAAGSVPFNLSSQGGTTTWAANNNGEVFIPNGGTFVMNPPSKPADATAAYNVVLAFNNSPTGFDSGYANLISLTVSWPAVALPANQTRRTFMRVITKY